jgi:hypothetical protein
MSHPAVRGSVWAMHTLLQQAANTVFVGVLANVRSDTKPETTVSGLESVWQMYGVEMPMIQIGACR